MSLIDRLVGWLSRRLDRLSGLFKGRDEFDLTSGDIAGPLFYLSLPIIVTNLLQTAYNLIDTFWLGQYSTEALAAISFAFPMVFLLISVGMGLSVAGSVLVAQHIGADEESEAEYAASQTVALSLLGAVILGLFGYVFVDGLLGLLGASPDVLPLATDYMEVISLGMPFMFGFFVFIALMRGYGDTITPMLVMLGSVLLNVIILDPFLIFGWGCSPNSASRGRRSPRSSPRPLALVVGLVIMFRGTRGVRIRLRQMRPDLSFATKLVRIGFPASIEGMGRALSINLLLVIVGLFPTYVVGLRHRHPRVLGHLPAGDRGRPRRRDDDRTERRCRQTDARGSGRHLRRQNHVRYPRRARRRGVARRTAHHRRVHRRSEVIEVGVTFLRYVAPSFGFIGVMRAYNGSFRGTGKTLTAAAIVLVTYAVIRLPIAYVLSQTTMEYRGIWLAFAASNVVGAGLAYGWYRRGTWRDADVTDGPPAPGLGDDLEVGETDASTND